MLLERHESILLIVIMELRKLNGKTVARIGSGIVFLLLLVLSATSCQPDRKQGGRLELDKLEDFNRATSHHSNVAIRTATHVGGGFDLPGNGAILLTRTDTTRPFWTVARFNGRGQWISKWQDFDEHHPPSAVKLHWLTYGQRVSLDDWTKFSGNPLVAEYGWAHNTPQTLELPATPTGQPQDQALLRGTGPWEDQWMLIFNISSFASEGLGLAIASQLNPASSGTNPFRIFEPYPLINPKGDHGPNDWVAHTDTFFAPDLMTDEQSYLWKTTNFQSMERIPIDGVPGHDAGLVHDGKNLHFFSELSPHIAYCKLRKTTCVNERTVLEVGGHTGDPDVSFFNNRWHMFVDTHPHGKYRIGYASTSPDSFPHGWTLHNREMIGPYTPDADQVWDDPTSEGNDFGTGDFDVALEGRTLYGTWERPVGLAYNQLEELYDGSDQEVALKIEVDTTGNGDPDDSTPWSTIDPGGTDWAPVNQVESTGAERFRIRIRLTSERNDETPLITHLKIRLGEPNSKPETRSYAADLPK